MKWFIGVFSLIVFFLPTSKVCSEVVQFQQISFTTLCENFQPSISGNGKKVVFLSDCDIVLGSNIDQNYEVFLYDLDKKTFYQITKTEGQGKNNQPSINYDGNYVTFRSSADLVPEKNADGNSEIFLYHTNTHHLDQITHSISPSINSHPIISKNARFLVFLSSSKLGGEEEDPESPQVFIYERERKSFSPLTNPVLSPSFGSLKNHRETHRVGLSKDGTKVLIATSFPHTQDEPLKRSRLSLTLYDLNTKEAFSINPPENLGNFGHIHFPPSLNGDGSRGVFLVNQGQPVLDEKKGGDQKLFLVEIGSSKWASLIEPKNCRIHNPNLSGDGSKVGFSSDCDFLGENEDSGHPNMEIFTFNTRTKKIRQVTHTIRDFNHTPSMDDSGSRMAFGSDRDIHEGSNLDENSEIFIAVFNP